MSRLKKTLGEEFADRFQDRQALKRVRVPGRDDEAVSGPIATRALEALGARAMTVDRTIIPPEDFDKDDPEQAALYAHEATHAERGAGLTASHHIHDAEESQARSVEQMVFHNMSAGEGFSGELISRAVSDGGAVSQGESQNPSERDATTGPGAVYAELLRQGKTREEIVEMLTQSVLESMDQQREEQGLRNPLGDAGSFNF